MHLNKTEDVVKVQCLDVEFVSERTCRSTSQLGDPDPFSTLGMEAKRLQE